MKKPRTGGERGFSEFPAWCDGEGMPPQKIIYQIGMKQRRSPGAYRFGNAGAVGNEIKASERWLYYEPAR